MKYCRRLKIWRLQQKLVDEGRSPAQANHAIREACGRSLSVTQLSEAIKRQPNHPNIRPLQRGAVGGVLPHLPPQQRNNNVGRIRLMDGSVSTQNHLLANV